MAEHWFISDTHFGHEAIIRYCSRPFQNAVEMDEFMIENWNKRVRPSDHITHLGDVTMDRGGGFHKKNFIALMGRLNGHKRLLLGNHDHFPVKTYLEAGFEKVYGTHRTDEGILLSHIPVHPKSIGRAVGNVHGHTHNTPNYPPVVFEGYDTVWNEDSSGFKGRITPYVNICVEMTEYAPITLGEVKERIARAMAEAMLTAA